MSHLYEHTRAFIGSLLFSSNQINADADPSSNQPPPTLLDYVLVVVFLLPLALVLLLVTLVFAALLAFGALALLFALVRCLLLALGQVVLLVLGGVSSNGGGLGLGHSEIGRAVARGVRLLLSE
ncbi:hypothetical protein GGR56DRAFT_678256 [Xylariaceae sp. FL0804]|nr:hypothetical protein GGR56DRAFT_678256 [Xylariaceae sp. FL0804]